MKDRLSYANVMATLAVFIALGGTSVAALSGREKKTVKRIIAAQAPNLSVKHAGTADSASPAGAAGGDLSGSYPNPSLRGADAPTLVGLSNSPLADCGGLVSTNQWYDVDNYVQVGFYRDHQGTVFLQGRALQCGTPSSSTIFNLPPGFRPPGATFFGVTSAQGDPDSVFVNALSGAVIAFPGSTDSVSLAGLSFRCGPSGANGCP